MCGGGASVRRRDSKEAALDRHAPALCGPWAHLFPHFAAPGESAIVLNRDRAILGSLISPENEGSPSLVKPNPGGIPP